MAKDSASSKFYKTTAALISTIIILLVVFKFLGPKIGSAFFLISKHKNDPVNEDTIPPSTPLFSNVPEATNKDTLTLNGIAEPGSTIKLFVNGPEEAKTTTNSEGLFTFVDIKINEGTNTIFAKATDQDGNESKKSKTLYIIFDDKTPEIEITSPSAGEEVKNTNRRIVIEGEINEQATVTINDKYAIVKPDNTFELLLGVDEGDVNINVKAIDEAGNKAEKSITVKYTKDD